MRDLSYLYFMNEIAFTALASMALSGVAAFGQTYDDPAIKIKAAEIHAAVLTLDTHADVPAYLVAHPGFDLSKTHNPRTTGSRVDFPRMRQGGLDAMFFAVYLGQGHLHGYPT